MRACEQANSILIQVADTGEGIALEHLPHVCDRFYRVDAGRARSEGGTSLGLAICDSICQAHGGTLEIESTLGEGTTVSVVVLGAVTLAPSRSEIAVPV